MRISAVRVDPSPQGEARAYMVGEIARGRRKAGRRIEIDAELGQRRQTRLARGLASKISKRGGTEERSSGATARPASIAA